MKTRMQWSGKRAGEIGGWTLGILLLGGAAFVPVAQSSSASRPDKLAGLNDPVEVTRDVNGIAHIRARQEHDLYFMQGYVHAQDRLFQMDTLRRLANGTSAELLGQAALPTDVQLRTIGLHRAAQRSLPALLPRTQAALAAYAEGVNAWVAEQPLPPEYAALQISQFRPWTALDSVALAKLISFNRAFELDIDSTVALLSYRGAGQQLGFDGERLFFEDLHRVEPFDQASTIPDASVPVRPPHTTSSPKPHRAKGSVAPASERLDPKTLGLAGRYLAELKKLPAFEGILDRKKRPGSNLLVVSGALTTTRQPLLANDTHLSLSAPSTFYPIHLNAKKVDVTGESFAGVPFVILGHNQSISWGGTTFYMDVTDTFQEQVVPDASSPSGLSTLHQGHLEPIVPIPEVFRMNIPAAGHLDNLVVVPPGGGIPPVTLIVPRRNNGPILQLDAATGVALSVQYTGFSPTRELDTFLLWNEAENLEDFQHGLQFFDCGALNFGYADVHGNIAYFTSGELPIREDLQAGTVNGLPPWFIRNGTGGNEWLPVQHPQPHQAVAFEILPITEMPHLINPPAGWFVNCNNDPTGATFDNNGLNQLRPGGGILYMSAYFDSFRAARVTQILEQKLAHGGRISPADAKAIQADTVLVDAQVFVPYLVSALADARSSPEPALAAFAADPKVTEAVSRLAQWDFTTPTGIPEGFDASDTGGVLLPPSSQEIASSVAATIYSVWRGQFIRNTLDAPVAPYGLPIADDEHALPGLRHLLETFPVSGGVGASGINFFNVPGVASAADRRDIIILQSLADSLNKLAAARFAAAFGNSSNLDDYRWGKLHRVVFAHTLGGPFNLPPAFGMVPSPLPGLDGIPTDGGYGTVDAAFHALRGEDANAFMFTHGPAMRYVSEAGPGYVRAESSLPGGVSGVPGSPFYANLLAGWLSNDTFRLLFREHEIRKHAAGIDRFVPLD